MQKVNLGNGSASVTYETDAASMDNFKRVVEDAGYEFRGEK
ncbi:hypothetical protein [Fodinibius salsisoli]